jgi:cardiolipin synthase
MESKLLASIDWKFVFIISYIISEWIIRIVMLLVVPQRRRPTSALAWLMIIFLQPWIGLVIFFLFGAQRVNKARFIKFDELHKLLDSGEKKLKERDDVVAPVLNEKGQKISDFVQTLGSMPPLRGNTSQLLPDAQKFYDLLVEDINNAKESIHMLFYIYNDDVVGQRIAEALAAAAKRGVICRLLVDSMGSKEMLKTLAPDMRKKGIEVHDALPVKSKSRFVGRVDMRNHRKVIVIDGVVGYTGSQNITDPSYGHVDLIWHDVMMRLTGKILLELQFLFISDWYMETNEQLIKPELFPEREQNGSADLQILPSGPIYPQENYQSLVVSMFYYATKRVIITTPYLVPDEVFMQAVQSACTRGIEVIIICPEKTDQLMPTLAARSYYESLLLYGARIYLHTDGLLHAKTMTIDGEYGLFGSSNFDIRSFAINFEVNLVIYDNKTNTDLVALQEKYLAESTELTFEEWNKRSNKVKLWQNVARLVSPML